MGGYNALADASRAKAVAGIISAMIEGENVEKIYVKVLALNPVEDGPMFAGVPMDSVRKSCLTLNVAPTAVGYLVFENGFMGVQCRFSGKVTNLDIPIGCVRSISALSHKGEVIHCEVFTPYVNQAAPVVEDKRPKLSVVR